MSEENNDSGDGDLKSFLATAGLFALFCGLFFLIIAYSRDLGNFIRKLFGVSDEDYQESRPFFSFVGFIILAAVGYLFTWVAQTFF
jgi:hypothetical protein